VVLKSEVGCCVACLYLLSWGSLAFALGVEVWSAFGHFWHIRLYDR
jgi:hypothetical protein